MVAKRTREEQHNNKNIPPEIWMEIHSRLPVKDVFKYQCVAKSWNPISPLFHRRIVNQPLCGLMLRDTTYMLEDDGNSRITYLAKGATQSIPIRTEISINKPLPVSSGFDKGNLKDTFFEFGPLSCLPEGEFFTIDFGLILTSHWDGTYHVYNPVTKQVLHLPVSPLVEKFGIDDKHENCAFLFTPYLRSYYACFVFHVMRVIPRERRAEMFSAHSGKWFVFKLVIDAADDDVLNSSWCSENVFYIIKTQSLILLTEKDQGLVVRFDMDKVEGNKRRNAWVYKLHLPQVVKGGFRKARLGGDGKCVYLSYYENDGGVWFWKRNCERLTYNDEWVLLLKIDNTPKTSTSLEHNHNPLFKLLKGGGSIIPIGFYPSRARALLRVKSTIFIYHLIKKKLEKFAEISDQEFSSSMIVIPYLPLLVPFKFDREPGKLKPGKLKPITVAAHLDMMNEPPL